MYRLSSFRPNSLGTGSAAEGGGGIESPPLSGTPLTEQPMASGSGGQGGGPMASSSTAFHRQNSQTGSNGQISPPSTSIPNVPTYETIDVANLSQHHLSGYNPAASTLEYQSSSSSGGSAASGSGHSQTSACGMDSSTAPIINSGSEVGQHSRYYSPYGPLLPLNRQPHHLYPLGGYGGASASYYFSRQAQQPRPISTCYPSSVDGCSTYYSVYGYEGGQGGGNGVPGVVPPNLGMAAAGRSTSESGIYSPTRRLRPSDYAQLQQQQMQLALMQQQQQQQSYYHHNYHHRRKSSADSGGSGSGLEEDFDIAQAIFALIALTAYMVSLGSSLALAYFLAHHEQDSRACGLTLAATLLPSLIVNILSLKWLLNDNHRQQSDPEYPVKRPDIGPCGWTARILLHIVLLGPALRYVDLLRFGVCSWSEKRRIEDRQQQHKGSREPQQWMAGTVTLPSLSTTLPRPRYLTGAEVPGLPAFEVAAATTTTSTSSEGTSSSPPGRRHPSQKCPPSPPVDYYMLTVYEDRDSSLLSLFRALLQCSLQLVLQLCSLLAHYQLQHVHHQSTSEYNHQFTEYVQLTVIGCSLFELAWSLASYHRSLRRASLGKRAMSALGMLLQFLWHLGTTAARLLAVALFVSQFGAWLVPVTIGHWGVMTVWIMHQGSARAGGYSELAEAEAASLSEYAFNMLVGAIYLVQFINVKDEPTRYKYAWYYGIVAAENAALAAAWALRLSESAELEFFPLRLPALAAVLAAFALGVTAMQLYYWCAHPSGRPLWANKAARCC